MRLFLKQDRRSGRLTSAVVAMFFVVLLFSVRLDAAEFDNEYDEKPWVEIEVQLPRFPESGNMIAFKVGAIRESTFLIDSESLSLGSDGVIRYTLEIVSASGAKNISYEGMRCGTAERRFYAFGRPDGTWSKARSNQWVKVRGTSNSHHVELFSNYFCPAGYAVVASVEDARRVLRSGGQISARNR